MWMQPAMGDPNSPSVGWKQPRRKPGFACVSKLVERAIGKVTQKARAREKKRNAYKLDSTNMKNIVMKSYWKHRDRINTDRREASGEKKEAARKVARRSYAKHQERRQADARRGYQNNRQHILEQKRKDYYANMHKHHMRMRLNYSKHRKARIAWVKMYAQTHREQINSYIRNKRIEDPAFAALSRQRGRIKQAIKRGNSDKAAPSIELLGCNKHQLYSHLSAQYDDGESMTTTEIDHVFPCVAYDMLDESQQRQCFNVTNLQPLTREENGSKSDRAPTKAMAAKVERWAWPPGITEDMLPDKYDGWETPLRM